MNSRECVIAAIEHREPERIPHCIGCAMDMKEKLLEERGIIDEDEMFNNDVIRLHPPWWQWKNVDGLMDSWTDFDTPASRPTITGDGSYAEFYESVERAHDAGKYVLTCVYGSHFEKAYFARGIENFLADMAGSVEWSRAYLKNIIRRNLVMLENFLSHPHIDGVLLGSDWGSQCDLLMSPASWQDLIRPGEQAEYDLIKSYGKHVWIHSCGNVVKIIPSLIEMGIDVLNPVQPECMDIAMLKREYGKDLTFWGGLSTQKTLPYGTPDDVRREAQEVRKVLGAGGGLIFAPAQEIQSDVPLANLDALIEVAGEGKV